MKIQNYCGRLIALVFLFLICLRSNPIKRNDYSRFFQVSIYNTQSSWNYCFTLEDFSTNSYSFKNCSVSRIISQRYRIERSVNTCNSYIIINEENENYKLKKSTSTDLEIISVNGGGGVAIKILNQNLCLENDLNDNNVQPFTVNENQFFKTCLPYDSDPKQVFYFTQVSFGTPAFTYSVNLVFPLSGDVLAKNDTITWMNTLFPNLRLIITDNTTQGILEFQITSNSFSIILPSSQSGYTASTNSLSELNIFYLTVRSTNIPVADITTSRGNITPPPIILELHTTRIYSMLGNNCRFCKDLDDAAANIIRFIDCNYVNTLAQYFNLVKISTGPDIYNITNLKDTNWLLNYSGDSSLSIIASGSGFAIKISSQNLCLTNNLNDNNIPPYRVIENQFFTACGAFNGLTYNQVFSFYPYDGEPYTGSVNRIRILVYTKFDDIDANLNINDINYMNSSYATLRITVTYPDTSVIEFPISNNDFNIDFLQCWNGCTLSTNSATIGNTKFTLNFRIPTINAQDYYNERCHVDTIRIIDYVNTTGVVVIGGNTYITFLYSNFFLTGNNPWFPSPDNMSSLKTTFTRLRYDIALNRVKIDDFSYSTSVGLYMSSNRLNYAVTAACGGPNGTGTMNFRGTPFRIKVSHGIYSTGCCGNSGSVTLSSSNQVGTLSYNGYCGGSEALDLGGGWAEIIEPIP